MKSSIAKRHICDRTKYASDDFGLASDGLFADRRCEQSWGFGVTTIPKLLEAAEHRGGLLAFGSHSLFRTRIGQIFRLDQISEAIALRDEAGTKVSLADEAEMKAKRYFHRNLEKGL